MRPEPEVTLSEPLVEVEIFVFVPKIIELFHPHHLLLLSGHFIIFMRHSVSYLWVVNCVLNDLLEYLIGLLIWQHHRFHLPLIKVALGSLLQ